ncbi:AraC family transcriptional regulator [Arenibacter palladensis]|uniref:AraC family transcriptional regulator n=1 Tax=Arenibacter palladensis TaxID=237373 RepID=UPI0026E1A979|nr:AraC family transcriptional regulator [Arenibacter palladensis]MDO6605683.1 AraC family transcriptional regulator [Arenibacter palladensis]
MKPLYLKKNTQSSSSSFFTLKTDVPHYYDKWHYHLELELFYVVRGRGTRIIGDSVMEFDSGDMVLVGSNLPHVWKNDPVYYVDDTVNASAILVQFLEDFMGDTLWDLPEMIKINKLFEQSSQGIQVDKKTSKLVVPMLEELVLLNGSKRLIRLLEILDTIATGNYKLLSSNWFSKSYSSANNRRIADVYDYIMENFTEKITLEDMANVANMNTTALCRYFKATTKKTITQFINEIRVGYAVNLLNTKDCSIKQACFESGFNNLSYFCRQFKKILGYSPSQLKKNK